VEAQRWLLVPFQATGLFSLRESLATSWVAKTNLLPTPYSIKLAMLEGAIRSQGVAAAAALFPIIRDREICIEPPVRLAVTGTLVKVLRVTEEKGKREDKTGPDPAEREPFKGAMAYREFVFYGSDVTLAMDVTGLGDGECNDLVRALRHVSSFGKRGSFFQNRWQEQVVEGVTPGLTFARRVDRLGSRFYVDQVIQQYDEMGPEATWEAVNTYSTKPVRLGLERVLVPYAIPLRMRQTGARFVIYERSDVTV
jgi:hypothetical protein